ncbi:MAG: pilus assembly protein TadG-related protein [Candidatus Nanopelagicales bacterium]
MKWRLPRRLNRRDLLGGGQLGQVIVWTAVMLPLFLSVIGLAADGGVVFSARRELQNVADSAARAGAMQVDQRVYRESSGATVVLDLVGARQVAAQYVASQGSGLAAAITADPRQVVVQVGRDVPTSFLRLAGINTVHLAATASAGVRDGVERGNR